MTLLITAAFWDVGRSSSVSAGRETFFLSLRFSPVGRIPALLSF
jgi:hypothetical protein